MSGAQMPSSLEIARFGEPKAVVDKGGFPELRPLVLGVHWERAALRKRIETRRAKNMPN